MVDANTLELDLPAQVSVAGVTVGYGVGLRNPIMINGEGGVNVSESEIKGGVFSNLPSEPTSAAVKFASGSKSSTARGLRITAPSVIGTAEATTGFEIGSGYAAPINEGGNIISGFTSAYKGFSNTTATRCIMNRKINLDIVPSATIDTYGTDIEISPRKQTFEYIMAASLEFNSISSETLTIEIEAHLVDGGTNSITVAKTSSQTVSLTALELAGLHSDNQKITSLAVRSKSSKASSTAKGVIAVIGIES